MAEYQSKGVFTLKLDCIVCGSPFEHTRQGNGRYPRFCSEACSWSRKLEQGKSYRVPKAHNKTCPRCSKAFTAKWITTTCCSRACSLSLRRKARRAAGLPVRHSKRTPAQAAKKNAIRRGAYKAGNVDPFVVFRRDKWICQICFRKTDKRLRGSKSHDLAPELDHIIPISKGGSHTYENTQCACKACNLSKGARVMGQLHLFA